MEKNWRYKTIEQLEKSEWPDFELDSRLIKRSKQLRRTQLDQFSIEDVRLMISQRIGLEYLVPKAFEILSDNLFAEGDLYEGDLLKAVLEITPEFWNDHKELHLEFQTLIEPNKEMIKEYKLSLSNFEEVNYSE